MNIDDSEFDRDKAAFEREVAEFKARGDLKLEEGSNKYWERGFPFLRFNPDQPRVAAGSPGGGQFGEGGGSGSSGDSGGSGSESTVQLKPSKMRAFNGDTIETKTKLTKLETGALGESIIIQHLKDAGFKDAGTMNSKGNNFAVDLVQDHELIEVKTGLVSNGKTAQHWRATIGQPGPEETKALKKMGREEKAKYNAKKAEAILDRKKDAMSQVGKKLGATLKGKTMTVIINPDTKIADIYEFKGFHLRIPWNSPQAKAGYKRSVKYG